MLIEQLCLFIIQYLFVFAIIIITRNNAFYNLIQRNYCLINITIANTQCDNIDVFNNNFMKILFFINFVKNVATIKILFMLNVRNFEKNL